jgi:hypothetical protein
MNPIEELEQVCPEARKVVLRCGEKSIMPLKVRQLAPFARALRDIPEDVITGLISGRFDALEMAECTPQLVDALHAATGVPADELLDYELDDLIGLAIATIEVNADFFLRRLAPMLNEATSQISAMAGHVPSNGSLNPATVETTSSNTH